MSDRRPDLPPPPRDGTTGSDADRTAGEVLGKLEALLGRLRAPDAPAAQALAQASIPTLTEPVVWGSPQPPDAAAGHGQIPTLTEPVELAGARLPAATTTEVPPTFARETVVESTATGTTHAADAAPVAPGTGTAAEPDLPDDTLRERLHRALDPELAPRLARRAIAELDRTLLDLEHDLKRELAAWRDEQAARIHAEARTEVERALDAVIEQARRPGQPGTR